MTEAEEIIKKLEQNLSSFEISPKVQNIGTVETNTDGVVRASGLSQAVMGEIVEFETGDRGVILNLDQDFVSIILFSKGEKIKEGNKVKRTGNLLSVNVSEELLGRVVNPLGEPQDGKSKIKKNKLMPLEKIAPGVIEREPVNTPLKTGIKTKVWLSKTKTIKRSIRAAGTPSGGNPD